MSKWHLIEQQQKLREIFKEPPLISYKRGRSLKDILVRAKLQLNMAKNTRVAVAQAYLHSFLHKMSVKLMRISTKYAC